MKNVIENETRCVRATDNEERPADVVAASYGADAAELIRRDHPNAALVARIAWHHALRA